MTPRTSPAGRPRQLEQVLAVGLPAGAPILHGWVRTSWHWSTRGGRQSLLLAFIQPAERLEVVVEIADPSRPAYVRGDHFGVSYSPGSAGSDDRVLDLCRHVGSLLAVSGLRWPTLAAPRNTPAAPPHLAGDEFGLAFAADCEQACSFCGIRRAATPADGGEALLAERVSEARVAREQGATRIRLSGFDPLRFSRIVRLVGELVELGFESIAISSPGTRLADADFASRLLDAGHGRLHFQIALLGPDAVRHDGMTGAAGSFGKVMAGLRNVRRRTDKVTATFVLARTALPHVAATATLARQLGIGFLCQTVFPTLPGRDDAYEDAVVSLTEVAEVLAASFADRDMPRVAGLPPCVLQRAVGGTVAPSAPGAIVLGGGVGSDGGLRATGSGAPVPCPHRTACSAASGCPQVLPAAYAARFGLGELAPP